jgi:hypothetical protein
MALTRRDFIGATALGTMAVRGIGAPAPFPTRAFGSTGMQVPLLAFGSGSRFMQYEKEEDALAALGHAIDLGINYVDTAHNYGGGKSEERVGKLMAARRKDVILGTKLNARKADEARRQLELSLKRLQTDHVDVLHIHSLESLDDLAAIEAKDGVLRVVQEAREQKMTRFIGITGHADPEAMQKAIERNEFDCVQMALNAARARMQFEKDGPKALPMVDRSYESLALPVAVRKKMGVIAMKAFGQDQLVGRAPIDRLLYYSLSLPVSMASVGMPKPEMIDRNAELARAFQPLAPAEMQSLRASLGDSGPALAQFFRHHVDA